ncbi:GntR family transcriptional regulator [Clostridiaceae bacterium]|nr:GntR family transcriptional regulator [Clostridiaceae bacterium]
MKIIISNSGERPIYEQIAGQIKNAIMSGELPEGAALPSLRFLARELRVSIISTKRAYEELEKEGYIESFQGKGSFVTARNRELMREEQFKKIEACLQGAVEMAKISGISLNELEEVLEELFHLDGGSDAV